MNEPIVYTEIYRNTVMKMKLFRDEDKLTKFIYSQFDDDDAKKLLESERLVFEDHWGYSIDYPEY